MIDVYIASPYSHPDPAVRRLRFEQACRYAGRLLVQGITAFSPIAHSHPIAELCDLPKGFEFWRKFDHSFLSSCDAMHVLQLDGWQDSAGILAEIEIAESLGIVVSMIDGAALELLNHEAEQIIEQVKIGQVPS
jgi:hypothetical protein